MRTLLVILLVVAALDAQTTTAPAKNPPTRTFFEEHLGQRSTLIVRARFRKDESVGSLQVTHFTVLKTIKGDPRPSVGVVGIGEVASISREVDRILFLRREGAGFFFSLVDATDLLTHAAETEACIYGWCQLSTLTDPSARRQGWRRGIFDGLKSSSLYARRLAVRETVQMMRQSPSWFHGSDIPALRAAVSTLPPQDRDQLLEVAIRLETLHLESYAGLEDGIPKGALRDEFLKGLIALSNERDVARRAAIFDALVSGFARKADPLILRALDDPVPAVRSLARRLTIERDLVEAAPQLSKRVGAPGQDEAESLEVIECLGWLGDDSVSAVTKGLTLSEPVALASLTALGRIGSPSALNVLSSLKNKSDEQPTVVSTAFRARLVQVLAPGFRAAEIERRPKSRVPQPK